jgi:L-fuculose-phosphate aldolase
VGSDLITAYYRMETLELYAKISLTAHLLGGEKEVSEENIHRLIGMRGRYGVTGRHPGFKRYRGRRYLSGYLKKFINFKKHGK